MTSPQHETTPPTASDGHAGTGTAVHDVVVVGGGPAGLQAALTIGRVHRDVLLLDAGEGRNAPADAVHNLLTREGTPPAELRRIGREELAAYPTVRVRAARVRAVTDRTQPQGATSFTLELEDGDVVAARRVVLATGVRDELPDVPGLAELWGDLVAACPFCHGHELAGRRVGVLGAGPAGHLPLLLAPVAGEVVVLADGQELAGPVDAEVVQERVAAVARHGDGLRVELASGASVDLAGLFVGTTLHQTAPLAAQLDLDLNPSGGVRVDERGRTSRRGVYAAGDMAHVATLPMPMTSVVVAMAAGSLAGATAVADLVMGG